MPNWCYNNLTVKTSVPVEEWAVITEDGTPAISFDKIDPIPDELRNTTAPSKASESEKKALIEKYGHCDWFDWQIDNWGTKWNVVWESATGKGLTSNQGYENLGGGVHSFSIDTAWSPPLKVLVKLGELLSKKDEDFYIEGTYDEESSAYAGEYRIAFNKKTKKVVVNDRFAESVPNQDWKGNYVYADGKSKEYPIAKLKSMGKSVYSYKNWIKEVKPSKEEISEIRDLLGLEE